MSGTALGEPTEILRQAAMDAMRQAATELRKRGWPVEMIVDYLAERQSYAVSLRVELPFIPIPIEVENG